jgi:DNA polymerase-3 subunit alpha
MAGDQHNYRVVDKSGAGVYSRNSHACAYSFISYQTAWLKCYYRVEFMCALLTFSSSSQDEDKKIKYEKNARDRGIKILPVDINKSRGQYEIETDGEKVSLRPPLNSIKGVGDRAVESVVKNQPYNNLMDFISKVDGTAVNASVFNTLADTGCMRGWKMTVEELKNGFIEAREKVRKGKKVTNYHKKFESGGFFD